jgi:hypothetical protein
MRLLRMRSGGGIYRGGKLLGIRLGVSEIIERSEIVEMVVVVVKRGSLCSRCVMYIAALSLGYDDAR